MVENAGSGNGCGQETVVFRIAPAGSTNDIRGVPETLSDKKPSWIRRMLRVALVAAMLLVLAALPFLWKYRSLVDRTPAQRLEQAHLEATHAGVVALQAQRLALPPRADGLQDFRCIFHAHAEDAVHTGGTRPEMLADAKRAGVHAIFLSDHFRPPRDYMDSWRGFHEGVLFVPGSEVRGFLAHPEKSVMAQMDLPVPEFVKAIGAGEGLIFLSHIEERPDHSMEGLNGLEIYNRHYDAKRDLAGLIAIAMKLTDPDELAAFGKRVQEFPDEILASQVRRPDAYLEKWDREILTTGRRFTGVAANDCHHNQVFIVKMVDAETVAVGTIVDKDEDLRRVSATVRPGIRKLTTGRNPGDVLARIDVDPYFRSFRNVSTHVLATELTEKALREALRAGHAYVAHEWICDATGFRFEVARKGSDKPVAILGDELRFEEGLMLSGRAPVPCRWRIYRDGKLWDEASGREFKVSMKAAGVYRCETTVLVHGEAREWIYSNPIYVR